MFTTPLIEVQIDVCSGTDAVSMKGLAERPVDVPLGKDLRIESIVNAVLSDTGSEVMFGVTVNVLRGVLCQSPLNCLHPLHSH